MRNKEIDIIVDGFEGILDELKQAMVNIEIAVDIANGFTKKLKEIKSIEEPKQREEALISIIENINEKEIIRGGSDLNTKSIKSYQVN